MLRYGDPLGDPAAVEGRLASFERAMRSDSPDEEPAAWHVSQDEVARSAGTFVDIRVGRDGEVDIQQREPGRGRQSLGHGPSPVSQQHREAGLGLGG